MFCKSVFESPQHFIALACDLFEYPQLGIRELENLLLKVRSPSLSLQYSIQFLKQKSIESLALTICRFTSQLSDLSQGNSMSSSLQKQLSQSSLLTEVRHQITHGQMPSYQTIVICKELILKNLQQKYWRAKVIQYCQSSYIIDWSKVEILYKRIYQKEYHEIDPQPQFQKGTSLNYMSGYTDNTNLFQAYKKQAKGSVFNILRTPIIGSLNQLEYISSEQKQMQEYVCSKFQVSLDHSSKSYKTPDKKSKNKKSKEKQQVLQEQSNQLSYSKVIAQFSNYKMKQYFEQYLKITCEKQNSKYSKTEYKVKNYDFERDLKLFQGLFSLINNFQRKMLLILSLNQFAKKPSSQFLYRLLCLLFQEIDKSIIANEPLILNKLKKLRFLHKIGKCQKLFKNVIPKQLSSQVQAFWNSINNTVIVQQ